MALLELTHDWAMYARPEQLPPIGDWFVWLFQGGRGSGKTRSGAEFVRDQVDREIWRTVNIAGPAHGDVMDYMIRGTHESPGLMGIWPPHQRPRLNKNERRLTAHNGAIIRYRAAHDADTEFRGPQADGGWADEIDAWKPQGMKPLDAFELFELGIRLGKDPRIVCTSTPKPGRLVKALRARDDIAITYASTYDNRDNLSAKFLRMIERYRGTHKERQEILGELIEEVQGAIVTKLMIEELRVFFTPELVRVVVGVDPYGGGGDACGITAVGKGVDAHGYLLADRTCRLGPDGWGSRAVETALEFHAESIAVETNYGGNMCTHTILAAADALGVPRPRVRGVPSTTAKHVRFSPQGARYERGEMHHVGTFDELEEEVCNFTPESYDGDGSPNRVDSEVIALTELFPVHAGISPSDLYGEPEEARA